MTTVELFAGIGGFRLAAEREGFQTVWANDVCPKACKVYRERFGENAISEGDIRQLVEEAPDHDLLTAGFPCQPFSSAGKKEGIQDPRGTLFHIVAEVLRRRRPRFFVLENVKRLLHMDKGFHFATILATLARLDYLIEWRLLNAMNFGLPQNRQRVFLLGIRTDVCSAMRGGKPRELLPIRLATAGDVSQLSKSKVDWLRSPEEWMEIESHGVQFPHWGLAKAGKFFSAKLSGFSENMPQSLLHSVLEKNVSDQFDFTDSTLERMNNSIEVNRFVDGVQILANQKGGARMGYTVFGIDGVAPTLTSTTSRHYERYQINGRYRRLTNVEYARIQGFPDDHCSAVSVYDQYALLGNAVPPPMANWVIRRLATAGLPLRDVRRGTLQRELFVHV